MNQGIVKDMLLELDNTVPDFSVIFSGKSSRKVDGLYKPDSAEIIIHNRNFKNESALVYTAIHEFAHHIQFVKAHGKVSSRAHSIVFWDIFHRLLFEAEKKGIYKNIFKTEPAFIELAQEIREKYLRTHGELVKDFGKLLMRAYELCHSHDVSFEDFVDRELGLHRNDAKMIMRTHTMDIDPSVGYDNMKVVARVRDDDTRKEVERAFREGKSPDMVKAQFRGASIQMPQTPVDELRAQKKRIADNIERLRIKLAEIELKIRELSEKEESQ
jgi:hypothetical protein